MAYNPHPLSRDALGWTERDLFGLHEPPEQPRRAIRG
jgi:hypothetical protein